MSQRQRVIEAVLTREPRGFSPVQGSRYRELSWGAHSGERLGNVGSGEEEKRNTKGEKHNR